MLHEKAQRRWAACEARALGVEGSPSSPPRPGCHAPPSTAASPNSTPVPTLLADADPSAPRIRRTGGGRHRLTTSDPTLLKDLEALVDPATRGDPQSPLLWTCKSTRNLAEALVDQGHQVSHQTVARLLQASGYNLQVNRKTREGASHPDRDAQFEYIATQVRSFQRRGQPVVSVDTKKKELVGDFKNAGREWQPEGSPEEVRCKDFKDKELGKVAPYGVYDQTTERGLGQRGDRSRHGRVRRRDAAALVVAAWGIGSIPGRPSLLVTADGGGSNGSRSRLWKVALQGLADEIGLRITVCHFPPGTSKWNKIEHRMFCHITENWRGRPLVSRAVVVNLIGNTKTKTGLRINAELDTNTYKTGLKVTDEEFATIKSTKSKFHGEWNYTILTEKNKFTSYFGTAP